MAQSIDDIVRFAHDLAIEKGLKPPSRSMVEDWIFEDFIPAGEAQGRHDGSSKLDWRYPDQVLQIVSEIIDLRSRGARRHSQLRVCLFLRGLQVDFGRLQQSIREEHFRCVRWLERYASIYSVDPFNRMPERRRIRLKARLERLTAARLTIGGLDLFYVAAADLFAELSRGEPSGEAVSDLLSKLLKDQIEQLLLKADANLLPKISLNVSAIFDPEQKTREFSPLIDALSIEEMIDARTRLNATIHVLATVGQFAGLGTALGVQIDTDAYARVAQMLRRAEFAIPAFIMFAVDAHRTGKRAAAAA